MRRLLSILDLSRTEIEAIFAVSEDLKAKLERGVREPLLPGRMLALLFQKPSLRTRVSFETAMTHLGGGTVFLDDNAGFGKRESIHDFGRVLGSYVDAIVVRSFSHEVLEQLAEHSPCPVINGLTDDAHPCQALADLFTVRELRGDLQDCRLAFVGDGNNVARSLALICGRLGVEFRVAAPRGYEFPEEFRQSFAREFPDAEMLETTDPREAVDGADVVYTDVWASMGQEEETETRNAAFAGFQVDSALMALAAAEAIFLHCLPAHRGLEVSAEVIDGPQSQVFRQAGARMHVQKGVLAWLLSRDG